MAQMRTPYHHREYMRRTSAAFDRGYNDGLQGNDPRSLDDSYINGYNFGHRTRVRIHGADNVVALPLKAKEGR